MGQQSEMTRLETGVRRHVPLAATFETHHWRRLSTLRNSRACELLLHRCGSSINSESWGDAQRSRKTRLSSPRVDAMWRRMISPMAFHRKVELTLSDESTSRSIGQPDNCSADATNPATHIHDGWSLVKLVPSKSRYDLISLKYHRTLTSIGDQTRSSTVRAELLTGG